MNKLFVAVIVTFLVFTKSYGQTVAKVKALYFLNFVDQTQWKEKKTPVSIAVIGAREVYNEVKKNQAIQHQVTYLESFRGNGSYEIVYTEQDLPSTSALVVGFETSRPDILLFRKGTGIVFQVNVDQMKNKGFQPSSEMLVYGGGQEDVLKELKETNLHLSSTKEELIEKSKELQLLSRKIEELNESIEQKDRKRKQISQELIQLDQKAANVTDSVQRKQQLIQQKETELIALRQEMKLQDQLFNTKKSELIDLRNTLKIERTKSAENSRLMSDQYEDLSKKERELDQLSKQASTHRSLFVLSCLGLLIISLLLYFLVRENGAKKKTLEIIEKKNEEIVAASLHKDEFIASLSHEVRTPLNAIIGYSNLLHARTVKPENKESIEHILLSSKSLLGIINDILDFSKIEAGKIDLEQINFDLRLMLENTFNSLQIKAKEKGINYQLIIDDDVPDYLKGDPLKINQILLNLLSNAIKFTDQGSVKLLVDVKSKTEREGTILFQVLDTGTGIATDKLEVIFESFSQEDSSVTRKFGGTGLGLSISQKLVQLMGSSIAVESQLGRGTRFSFQLTLPISNTSDSIRDKLPDYIVPGLENKRIIYADDSEINRKLLINVLKDWSPHLQVEEANSGQDLLQQVSDKAYDLVLTDVRMPGLSGLDVTKEIRRQGIPVKIIGISANAVKKDIQHALEAGMDAYITKPIDFGKLVSKIAQQLELPILKREEKMVETATMPAQRFERLLKMTDTPEEAIELKAQLIQEIQELLDQSNFSHREGHSLVNKCNYVNDPEFTEICSRINSAARNQDANLSFFLEEARKKMNQIVASE